MHQVLGSHSGSAIVFGIPPGLPVEERTDKNSENMTDFLTNMLISLHRCRNRGNEKKQQKYKYSRMEVVRNNIMRNLRARQK